MIEDLAIALGATLALLVLYLFVFVIFAAF